MATQTKSDVKNDKREKKSAGLLARLFGGGGSGGTVGVGSFGGAGGAGGASGAFGGLLGGGLLATKTGLLAMLLVGSTVAGGLGLIGYHLMGSGSSQSGDNVNLFATKPKTAAIPEVQPVPEDGSSDSLKFFAQANAVPGSPELPQAAAPQDATAAGAAASASDAANGTGPAVAAGSTDNGVNKTLLKGGKFGALTGPGGDHAAGRGGPGAAAAKPGADLSPTAAAARAGTLIAMKNGAASSNGARSLGARSFGNHGALGQAFGAMRDNKTATSSAGGGATYDGAAGAGGNIGANGTPIGAPGVTDGSAAAQAKSLPGPSTDPNLAAPPTPSAVEACPWQNAIKTAQMLIGLAVGLLLVASLLSKTGYGHIIAMIVAAVVGGIGAMVIALGAQIAHGQYGQVLQGGVLAAAGTGLIIAAAATAFGGGSNSNSSGLNESGTTDATSATDATSGGSSGSGSALSNINPFVLIGGGLGLIGLAGTMMAPPKKYPSSTFQNGNPPDTHFFGYRQSPSETALKKMVA